MEPFGYGKFSAVRYWPLNQSEDEKAPLLANICDSKSNGHVKNGNSAEIQGAWRTVAGGLLEVCQVGSLSPLRLDSSVHKKGTGCGIYRRRLLMRPRPTNGLREKFNSRELIIFHFACEWDGVNQVHTVVNLLNIRF